MTRSLQAVAYTRPSVLESVAGGHRLGLETSRGATPTGVEDHPRFFTGFLASPQVAAAGLLAVADVAAARYYQQQLRASLDPVVTGNGDRLRFESFSGCGGVYARLDVLEPGLDGGEVGHGTTNVDVNNPLREALSRVGSDDPLHLRVGPDELAVTTLDGPVVEKKVPLPDRWLRGFAEAQVIAAGFDLRAELPAAEAVRFLRSLPRGGSRGGLRGAPSGSCPPDAVCGRRRGRCRARCVCRVRSGWSRCSGCCAMRRHCACTARRPAVRRPWPAPGRWSCPVCGSR